MTRHDQAVTRRCNLAVSCAFIFVDNFKESFIRNYFYSV